MLLTYEAYEVLLYGKLQQQNLCGSFSDSVWTQTELMWIWAILEVNYSSFFLFYQAKTRVHHRLLFLAVLKFEIRRSWKNFNTDYAVASFHTTAPNKWENATHNQGWCFWLLINTAKYGLPKRRWFVRFGASGHKVSSGYLSKKNQALSLFLALVSSLLL